MNRLTTGGKEELIQSSCGTAGLTLGYHTLKEEQLKVRIAFVLHVAVVPTGFGKSLCYTVLPSVFDSLNACSGSVVVCISHFDC